MATEMVRLLLDRLAFPTAAPAEVLFTPDLIIRDSA